MPLSKPNGPSSSSPSSSGIKKRPSLSLPASLWNRRKATHDAANASGSAIASPDQSPGSTLNTPATTSSSQPRHRTRSGLSAILSPRVETDEQLDPLLTAQYPDPEAVKAFVAALEEDQGKQEPPNHSGPTGAAAAAWTKLGLPTLKSPPVTSPDTGSSAPSPNEASPDNPTQTVPVSSSSRVKVGKIAAVSDFAPVRERTTSRRGANSSAAGDTGRREGLIYSILRWPLLLAIFVTIGLEFFAYVFTRQIVNVVEWLLAHRGKKGVLRRKLRNAKTFHEWRDTALELDDYMQHEQWKVEDASGLYDWILIKKVLHSLKTFREQDETQELMAVLDLCCRNNFAGTENFRLYSETYYGTKYLIETYLAEVELGLQYVSKTDAVPLEQKRAFFRGVAKNLGRSGLALSGGGAFGYYHVGLVRALLDANLLPKIVSGTSAGGLIAALTCTRTDQELSRLLVPELADRITACEEPLRIWAARAWKTGARFDPQAWAEKAAFFTRGSLTFKEAFELTGKVLNVSVIPSDKHSPTKLLNHLTAPRCVIWSALLASAAVPGLLPPVCLLQKTRKGEFVPWNWGHRFKDGSLRVDIPLQDLHSMFHVNYPIVSQVNPHVHLFFFAPKGMPGRPVAHRKGKGWRGGFILSASEHVLKLHLSLNFKIIRDLDLLPAILGTDWSGVFLQRFDGAVTIWPKTRFWDWVRILSDPDRSELARMMRVGQAATFPKLHMIENRIRIERAVEAGRKACRQAIRKQQREAGGAGGGASAGAAGGMQTPGGGTVDTPNQDSGTDASIGGGGGSNRRHPVYSDTDGGESTQPTQDYFLSKGQSAAAGASSSSSSTSNSRNRPRPQGTNTPQALAAARRRFGNAMGMMAFDSRNGGRGGASMMDALGTPGTDGTISPASEIGTPGELPRPSRARSMGLDDDADADADADADGSQGQDDRGDAASAIRGHRPGVPGTTAPAAAAAPFQAQGDDGLDTQASWRREGHDAFNSTPSTPASHQRALTAADLTPELNRFSSRRNSRQHHQSLRGSQSYGDHYYPLGSKGGGGAGGGSSSSSSVSVGHHHHHHHRQSGSDSHSHSHSRHQDWSANRGSIGPESPWDQGEEEEGQGSSSESDESDEGV